MDLNRKLELVQRDVRSISGHEDIDATVRLAALDRVDDIVNAERAAIHAAVRAQIDASLPAAAPASA